MVLAELVVGGELIQQAELKAAERPLGVTFRLNGGLGF
jgi:hypothetical protein